MRKTILCVLQLTRIFKGTVFHLRMTPWCNRQDWRRDSIVLSWANECIDKERDGELVARRFAPVHDIVEVAERTGEGRATRREDEEVMEENREMTIKKDLFKIIH